MKTITILFGEMGSGKNYWGEYLASRAPNASFFDGDTVVPREMAERVSNFRPLTREVVAAYIDILIEEIELRAENTRHLFVAQALYFEQDRKEIKSYFESLGYCVQLMWVNPPWWRNARQILNRKQGFKWLLYWLFNKPFFQKPTHPYHLI